MQLKLTKTERGFKRGEFRDQYDKLCSLQKSSLATQDCIWLGLDQERMHLTQEMVAELLPRLEKFVYTGEL